MSAKHYKHYFCSIHDYVFCEGAACPTCTHENLKQSTLTINIAVDHFKDVPAKERADSLEYNMAMLCRQDKEQLDRIEKMLKKILIKVK